MGPSPKENSFGLIDSINSAASEGTGTACGCRFFVLDQSMIFSAASHWRRYGPLKLVDACLPFIGGTVVSCELRLRSRTPNSNFRRGRLGRIHKSAYIWIRVASE
jgi:hypothetical protein